MLRKYYWGEELTEVTSLVNGTHHSIVDLGAYIYSNKTTIAKYFLSTHLDLGTK